MTIYGRKDLIWKKHNLFFQKDKIMSIVPDTEHKSMFRVVWKDGVTSPDYYNSSRAKEHAMREALRIVNNTTEDTELEA